MGISDAIISENIITATNTKMMPRLTRFIATMATALVSMTSAASETKKVVFIAGGPSHASGEHEHRAGCLLLAEHLNRSGLPVEATVTQGWPADLSVFEGASAIVIYADGGGNHPAIKHLDTLEKLASSGVGLGFLHYAVEVPKGIPGECFLKVLGGYFETGWSVNPHWTASYKLPKHEVTQGLSDFSLLDEWYYHMRFREKMVGITPILTALPPEDSLSRPDGPHSGNPEVRAAILERKEPQHTLWLNQGDGLGRSFGFTGGHFHKNWRDDNFRRVVLHSILWTAKVKIPAAGITSKTPSEEEMGANLDSK
jgi:type 1 glutamine amidotransferase